jgi:GT2 family glycosyltransferase
MRAVGRDTGVVGHLDITRMRSMSQLPLVYVVILNWNLKHDTAECIESVLQTDYPRREIIVVDNGSTDGSPDCLRAWFPEVHVIQNRSNLGFTAGNNTGIRYAVEHEADHVLILNNDTIVDHRALQQLVRVSETEQRVGVVGPMILYHGARDTIWEFGARKYKWLPIPLSVGRGEVDTGQFSDPVPLDYVTGCAMLVRSEVFRTVGLFRSSGSLYHWYGGDNEFCYRVRKAGYLVLGAPRAKIWHKVSLTAKKASTAARYLRTRDRVIFYRSCPHGPHPFLTDLYLLVNGMKTVVLDLVRGHTDLVRPLVRGLYDGYQGDSSELRYL